MALIDLQCESKAFPRPLYVSARIMPSTSLAYVDSARPVSQADSTTIRL